MRSIKLFASAAVLIGGLSFASCSSDDGDAVSSEGNPSAGTVTDSNGAKYRLTKAGGISYSYDSYGKLSSIYVNGETYNASYNPFKLTSGESSNEKDVIDNIRLNANGYITGLREVYDYTSSSVSDHEEGTASLSYDGNGHLTRITVSSSSYEIYNGEKESYSGTATLTLTWNDGKLTKVTEESTGDDEDSSTYEFTYSNATSNPLCQYTPNILDFDLEILQALSCIGYLGKGPSVLPSSCKHENRTYYYSYGKLSSGLIDWYSKSSSSSSYTTKNYMYYSSLTSSSSKIIKSPFSETAAKKTRRSLFGIRPAKNNAE